MAFKTLTQLIELSRQYADMEDDGLFIDDAEVTEYLNQEGALLHSLVSNVSDGSLLAKNAGTLISLGTNSYQLPSDFDRLLDLSVWNTDDYYSIEVADPQDYATLTQRSTDSVERYYLQWNVDQGRAELFIFPPPSVDDIAVRYIPGPPVLSLGSDTLNYPSFWYTYVVLGAAIQMLMKEESDPQPLMFKRDRVERRIIQNVEAMIPTQVKTIRRTAGRRGRYYNGEKLP
jgi:hypothetical protein